MTTLLRPLRSLRARLRAYVGDRRRAFRRTARVPARLPCTVAPLDAGQTAGADLAGARTLAGRTRDLSGTGLTLLLSAVRVGDRYLTDRDGYLGVRLDLPAGPVHLLAAPTRFEQLGAGMEEFGFLLGARIIKMEAGERVRYLAYLNTLAGNERRAAGRARVEADTADAGQANAWGVMTSVFVAEAFDRFVRESARPRRS